MYVGVNGEIVTNAELGSKRIDEFTIHPTATGDMMRKLDSMVLSLERTEKCKNAYKKLKEHYEQMSSYLPKDRKSLIVQLDDCYTDTLILFEEYFYKNGYYDGIKQSRRIKNILFHPWKLLLKFLYTFNRWH